MVQVWGPKEKPEYRGFRCANCQRHLYKAWHHLCEESYYKTTFHFCNSCESSFESFIISIFKPRTSIDLTKFSSTQRFPEKTKIRLKEIVEKWNTKCKPIYKTFTCDSCGRNIRGAYHFWLRTKGVLSEIHFCKKCGDKFGLNHLK